MTGLAGYFFGRPAAEELYAGLDRQDGGRIAEALKESDISFAVNFRRQTRAGPRSGERASPVRQTRKYDWRLDSASQLRLYLQIAQRGIVDGKAGAAPLAAGRRFNCRRMAVSNAVVARRRAVSMTDGIKASTRAALDFAIRVEEAQLAKQMHERAPSWSLAQVVTAIKRCAASRSSPLFIPMPGRTATHCPCCHR
jgi:hypothetical protein